MVTESARGKLPLTVNDPDRVKPKLHRPIRAENIGNRINRLSRRATPTLAITRCFNEYSSINPMKGGTLQNAQIPTSSQPINPRSGGFLNTHVAASPNRCRSTLSPTKRNFFPKATRPATCNGFLSPHPGIDTLLPAIDSAKARKGINTVARRRFQRGSVFLNRTKTLWQGTYSDYVLNVNGVEQRVRRQIVLSPSRRADGSSVRKNEAKKLLQPHINRANERLAAPSRERKSVSFTAFSEIWERDYLCLSKPSTRAVLKPS
jgi:hypothetical protein